MIVVLIDAVVDACVDVPRKSESCNYPAHLWSLGGMA